MTQVKYDFLVNEPTTAPQLVELLNKMQITFHVERKVSGGDGFTSINWHFDSAVPDAEAASALHVRGGALRLSNDINLVRRTPNSWSTSIDDDWSKDEYKHAVGGISGWISWEDHGFGPSITEVQHLSRINSLSVIIPDEQFLNQFPQASILFFAAAGEIFALDLKSLKYLPFTDIDGRKGRIASVSGVELVQRWKERP